MIHVLNVGLVTDQWSTERHSCSDAAAGDGLLHADPHGKSSILGFGMIAKRLYF